MLDDERYASIESFQHALKLPEESGERRACARAPAMTALRLARRARGTSFTYGGTTYTVNSGDHASILARGLVAKVAQNELVAEELRATTRSRLVTVRPGSARNVLGLVTPLVLMIERWKRWR